MPARAPVNELQLRSRLALFYFVYFAMLGAYAPYFGLYLQRLAFTPQQIGVLLGLVPIVRMVFPTLWAWIADHHGNRRALVKVTAVGATLACSALLFGASFGWLLVTLFVEEDEVSVALAAITAGASTGAVGDGLIAVSDISAMYRISSATGATALAISTFWQSPTIRYCSPSPIAPEPRRSACISSRMSA